MEFVSNLNDSKTTSYVNLHDYIKLSNDSIKDIVFFNYNIRSYNANSNSFHALFESDIHYPHILTLTETWFTEDYSEGINGYDAYHTVRHSGRSGGISIYVKSYIKSKNLPNLSFANIDIEVCTVELDFVGTTVFVIGIYRPHSGTINGFIDSLNFILNSINLSKTCLILGDINVDILKDVPQSIRLMNFLQSYHFIPSITKPTRFSSNNTEVPSLLDQIWTNNLSYSESNIVLFDITDHCPTYIKMHCGNRTNDRTAKTKISFRPVTEIGRNAFKVALDNFNWSTIKNSSINIYVENFVKTINEMYTKHFPLKTKYVSDNQFVKPWITPQISKLIKIKSHYFELLKLGILTTSENNIFKNKIKSIINKSKQNYYKDTFKRNQSNIREHRN